ncbi:MAG: hypothetical protein CMK59_15490 [Proteobacteria bacterium]|nr:hypothetical protein [Pseudomonadota bacterium]
MLFWTVLATSALADTKSSERKTAQQLYDEGIHALEKNRHTKALESFSTLRNHFRDDQLSIDAELGIADVYFDRGDWDLARVAYDDFRRLHPRHKKRDYVDYQIGLMLYKKAPRYAGRDQTWTEQALYNWRSFEKNHPQSTYTEDLLEKRGELEERLALKELQIAEFYEQREAWESVYRRSQGLLKQYPTSMYRHSALELYLLSEALKKAPQSSDLLEELKTNAPQHYKSLERKKERKLKKQSRKEQRNQ